MDEDMFVMIIPILLIAIWFYALWSKHRQKMAEIEVRKLAGRAAGPSADYAELEERLQVVERIVTDGSYAVATQIEALRDRRQWAEAPSGKAD